MKTEFGMFTAEGNAEVQKIFETAVNEHLTWEQTKKLLFKLARNKNFREAADSAVLDEVYVGRYWSDCE